MSSKKGTIRLLTYHYIKSYIEGNDGYGCELITSLDEFNELKLKEDKNGSHIKLTVKCSCGKLFCVSFSDFKHVKKHRCNDCSLISRSVKHNKTHEEFIKELTEISGSEYTVLEKYQKATIKIKVRHNICDYTWDVRPVELLSGTRCPKCQGNIRNKNTDYFREELRQMHQNEYTLLSEYQGNRTKVLLRHNICNYEYWVTPKNILKGRKCPKCSGHIKKDTEYFKQEVSELVQDEYTVLGDYIKAKIKIKMKHNICGNEYEVIPDSFIRGSRCPVCAESKGEQRIRKILNDYKVYYKSQVEFHDLFDIDYLRFDFGIYTDVDCTKLKCLIEYDGIFHYERQYDQDGFEKLKLHDSMKENYCSNNNYTLIRIPYWEFESILKILMCNNIIS